MDSMYISVGFIVLVMCLMGISIFTSVLAVNLANHVDDMPMPQTTRFIIFGILARCMCQKKKRNVDACQTKSSTTVEENSTIDSQEDTSDVEKPSMVNDDDVNESKKDGGPVNEWKVAAEIIDDSSFWFVLVTLLILLLTTIVVGVKWNNTVLLKEAELALAGKECPA